METEVATNVTTIENTATITPPPTASPEMAAVAPGEIHVIRRNGKVTGFDTSKISVAITKAFLAVEGGNAAASSRIHETVSKLTETIHHALIRRLPTGGSIHIEDIQDQVELALMRDGEQKVARAYVLYRAERDQERQAEAAKSSNKKSKKVVGIQVTAPDGKLRPLDTKRLTTLIEEACAGIDDVSADGILDQTVRNLFDGVSEVDVEQSLVMSARTQIEQEPNYSFVASRLLLNTLRGEALTFLDTGFERATQEEMANLYPEYLASYLQRGIDLELLDSRLLQYDLNALGEALRPERDMAFTYLGLQTLYDRYFIHSDGTRFELPQAFFMRVAMGLAMNEVEREERAIEFYNLLSSFDFMSSTPTLFNSGTLRPQLSSCYLTSIPDDLAGIYGAIKDNALLSKYAGGLGNDWTRVRGMGAHIKGTNGKSQGVVPFLKVANDTAVA
ncbi:MAG TPA: ribonucleoside-diphosphate reductase subunit alpha, partial [Chromatiales bacterium]|nr:ribonucleoside-diphosphate reductase subunit alpha [Chromatiaceae bacterium]HIO54342.1 ribonucleoside-diphosphate reductase subunit alpha [Chromatiales bacterium]